MVALIWVGVFLVLFFRWLCGGWFARVLMCMLLMATLGAIGTGVAAGFPSMQIVLGPTGLLIGWAIGSVPVWCWRERMRSIAQADNRNAMVQYR